MKMYNKSDLSMNHGLLVSKDGDIVLPDFRIVQQANELETLIQKMKYLSAQPKAAPMPSLDGFKRRSIDDSESRKFEVSTPTMDAKADEAMKLMEELDDMAVADKANGMLDDFKSLLDFVTQDFVVDCGNQLYKFDTPMLGNVLMLTEAEVVNAIAYVCGMAEEKHGHGKKHIDATELSDEEFDQLLGIIANHDDEVAKMMAEDKAYDGMDSIDEMVTKDKACDGEKLVSSLTDLAQDVNDFCSDMGNVKE